MKSYPVLPSPPDGETILTRYADSLAVLIPIARTNLVTNPSFELNTSGWSAFGASISRTATRQYHGAYSLRIIPTAGSTDGAYFSPLTMQADSIYAISCKLLGAPGVPYKLAITSSTPTERTSRVVVGTGQWQWIWLLWAETSTSASRRLYVQKAGHASTTPFYIDGVQVELCGIEGNFPTTYIDGDQLGSLANQQPPAYGWLGTPHASQSYRSGHTRSGGRIMRLRDFGFVLTMIIGLGLATPQHQALAFAQLDASQYQSTRKPERSISLVGHWSGWSASDMESGQAGLGRLLDRDRSSLAQPAALCLQAMDCGEAIGDLVILPQLAYVGGLDGRITDMPSATGQITFTQYMPIVFGRDEGATLAPWLSIVSNGFLQRDRDGTWSSPGSGVSSGTRTVRSIAVGPDRTVFVGGDFDQYAGVAATAQIAQYKNGAWSAVGSGVASAATSVRSLAMTTAGILYAGGSFTSMSGVASTARIAKWNGATWTALGTGAPDGIIEVVYVAPDDTLYIGGSFTSVGGVANTARIAKWTGSTWQALGTGAPDGSVEALLVGSDGALYAGGSFTSIGGAANTKGIAKWTGAAWASVGGGLGAGTIEALALGANNILYAGGNFTSIGVTGPGSLAQWNGAQWQLVGNGLYSALRTNIVYTLTVDATGQLWVGGDFFEPAPSLNPARIAIWNGSIFLRNEAYLNSTGGNSITYALVPLPDGSVYIGGYQEFGAPSTATAPAITTIINDGTAETYPTITFYDPSVLHGPILLINLTTRQTIRFNVTAKAGEKLTLICDPHQFAFTSSTRGNMLGSILQGSQANGFKLAPGANRLAYYGNLEIWASWSLRYGSLQDALYRARLNP